MKAALITLAVVVVALLVTWVLKSRGRSNLSREQIVRELAVLLSETRPDVRILPVESDELKIDVGDDAPMYLNLNALERRVRECSDDEERRGVYQSYATAITDTERSQVIAENLDRIMPRLVTSEYVESLRKHGVVVNRRLPALGLLIAFVVDGESSVRYLTDEEMQQADLSLDQLYEIAMENLRAQTSSEPVRSALESDNLILYKKLDTYDATRLLVLPEFLKPGEVLAAFVPDRDTLGIMRAPESEDWSSLEELARIPHGEHLLLQRPIRVTSDGFEIK